MATASKKKTNRPDGLAKKVTEMKNTNAPRLYLTHLLAAAAAIAVVSIPLARADDDDRSADLPSPRCDTLQVPAGNELAFHAYAKGVQIYRWNGTSWVFVAPAATLFADAGYHGEVGIHFAGPTWESNSGSQVVGRRLAACVPDATAIPWLLLAAVSSEGPGVLDGVTYVQRVNTTGGLAPAVPGTVVGQE